MSDFSRISEEVIGSTYVRFGSKGVPSRVEHVRELLEWLEPLLVGPHIAYIIGKSTSEESTPDYMDGMVRRLLATEETLTEALDDMNPHEGAVTRKSVQVTSDGDLYISNNVTGTVHDSVAQFGVVHGNVHTRRGQR